MGEVYAAYDPELDRKVAVKLLRVKAGNGVSLAEGRQRTLREAQAIARLSHPNVVTVFDVGTIDEKVFIAMEFVDGNTVTSGWSSSRAPGRRSCASSSPPAAGSPPRTRRASSTATSSPTTSWSASDGQVRVMDFGLARQMPERSVREHRPRPITPNRGSLKVASETLPLDQGTLVLNEELVSGSDGGRSSISGLFDARLTRTGAMMGTPAYMAPEQFFGTPTDARTDQFSFCISFYEALYGERPFEGKRLTELTANVVQGTVREAPAATKVPFWVRKILLRGLRSAAGERYQSMAELLEDLGKDPRAKRRKWAVGAAVALLPLAVGFGVRQSVASHQIVCTGGEDKLAGIWEVHTPDQPEGSHQSQIHAAFLRTGKTYAADVYETVTRSLTKYAQSWSNMYKETCEATHVRHEQSEEVLDLRMSCLQERLNGMHALTDVFADATGEVVENAVSATNAMTTLDGCADVPTLRAVIRPPNDQQTVAKVADMRMRLAEEKARFDAGRWKQALETATRMIPDARALGYQPLLAELLGFVGRVQAKKSEPRAAEKTLIEAYRQADASRHDEVRAEAATTLVFVIGAQEGEIQDALRWSEAAAAVLQRLGGHELLRAWLLNNLGCAYTVHHDTSQAIAALKEGLDLKQKLLGSDHVDVALSEGNLAFVLGAAGRSAEALPHVDRAIEILERKLGPAHPDLFNQLNNRGEFLNAMGRPDEAIRSFLRAMKLWEREQGGEDPVLAYPLTGLGIGYLALRKPGNALEPLERALRLRARGQADPEDQAQTFFALARALSDSGREQSRARRLAEEARTAYAKSADSKELAAVQEWLRGHGST